MKNIRRLTVVFFGFLVFTAAVHAEMVPVSPQGAEFRQSPENCTRVNLQDNNLSCTSDCTSIADLGEWYIEFLPGADANIGQTSDIKNLQSLTDEHNSLKFCLSALISLGLCFSTHCVKRLSIGFVPDWYHNGGPFQIGHSHALMPGSPSPAQFCCFIQPYYMEDNHLPKYSFTVISLWWESQFIPTVLASRGPPDMS